MLNTCSVSLEGGGRHQLSGCIGNLERSITGKYTLWASNVDGLVGQFVGIIVIRTESIHNG